MQSSPSWDLLLTVFFIVSIGYSFVLQRDKVIVTLLAIYAGMVIASIVGAPLQQFFAGDKTIANQLFIRANTNSFTIQAGVFVVTTVLVSLRAGIGRSSSRSVLSTFELAIFSFLNTALILTAIFSFMDLTTREHFLASSRIARIFISHQMWWMIAPIIALVATGGLGGRRSNYDY